MKKIKYILFIILSFFAGFFVSRQLAFKKIVEKTDAVSKYICLFKFANEWNKLKQKGIGIEKYFKDKGYYSIAIYGMGDLGERFADEIKNTDISIKYAIDRSRKCRYTDIEIKNIDEILPKVDAVVVTPIYNFWEIQPSLRDKVKCPIISLEDVICNCG